MSLPQGQKFIDVNLVYKTKTNAEGMMETHKSRHVFKGYKQYPRGYYVEMLSLDARNGVHEDHFSNNFPAWVEGISNGYEIILLEWRIERGSV